MAVNNHDKLFTLIQMHQGIDFFFLKNSLRKKIKAPPYQGILFSLGLPIPISKKKWRKTKYYTIAKAKK